MSLKDYLILLLTIGLGVFIYLNSKNQTNAENKYREMIVKHEYSKDSILRLNEYLKRKDDSLHKEIIKLKTHEKDLEDDKKRIEKKYDEKYKAVNNADIFQLDSLVRSLSGFSK